MIKLLITIVCLAIVAVTCMMVTGFTLASEAADRKRQRALKEQETVSSEEASVA